VLLLEAANLGQFSASLGFEFADEVLVELAGRLGREAPRGSVVARLEGARFAVVAPFAREAPAEAWALALRDALGAGLHAASLQARLDLFVGVVLAPEHGDQAAELLRRAETALERARAQQSGVVIFTLEQDREQRRRVELSHALPDSIDSAGFAIMLQPKVDFAVRRVRGAEVLARWQHPTLGAIPPDEFLPLAEQTGSGGRLTRRVLAMALDVLVGWRDTAPHLELAVNLTASDIADPALPDFVLEQLRARGLPATRLVLEITESAVMRDADAAARHMEQLRHAGVRFAIDDFGTGFSSLALLNRLPFDELKIDKSFVIGAARDPDAAAIIRATVELARSLELRVVAEGVETEASWAMLAALGCDYAQGYLISRPLPAPDFDGLLRRDGPGDAAGSADPGPALSITPRRSGAA
jgi:predicted signal transduction protein with EAL and GGDEF domain